MRTRRRLQFLFTVLALTGLACNVSIPWMNTPSSPEISSITVTPQTGSGPSFNAAVAGKTPYNEKLICKVTSQDGSEQVYAEPIHSQDANPNQQAIPFENTFTFNVATPGTHSLLCELERSHTTWSEEFVVTAPGASANQTNPGPGDAPGPAERNYTQAVLGYKTLSSWVNTTGGNISIPNWCLPGTNHDAGNNDLPLTITADGAMSSDCQGQMTKPFYQVWTGHTTGQLDLQHGTVTWQMTMDIQNIFSPTSLDHYATLKVTAASSQSTPIIIAADGSASAEGTADWTYTCTTPGSHDDGYPQCGDYRKTPGQPTSFNEAGTLEWLMNFTP
jgi:hypothetical protein